VTFRDCLRDRFGVGARTCIFRVGGVIDYGICQAGSGCSAIIQPYLTVAGQTAPGTGIMLRGFNFEVRNDPPNPPGHDVIVRHLRIRNRFYNDSASCEEYLLLTTYNPYNVIFDHVSTGWNYRSAWSAGYGAVGITFQWSILSEGIVGSPLCTYPPSDSNPPSPSLGGVDNNTGTGDPSNGVSRLHNYYAHVSQRMPVQQSSATEQLVNNVMYNVGVGSTIETVNTGGSTQPPNAAMVNNYFYHGPNTNGGTTAQTEPIIYLGAGLTNQPPSDTLAANSWIYFSGNVHNINCPTGAEAQSCLYQHINWGDPAHAVYLNVNSTQQSFMPTIASQVSATQAMNDVLNHKVGAYAGLSQGQDSIDLRAIRALANHSSGVWDQTSTAATCSDGECGETGVYTSGTPYTDTDGDGISDAWETAHGLNPNDPSDGPRIAANGYSNLENYLNELAGDTISVQNPYPPELYVHWAFDEGTGGTTVDTGTCGCDGTLTNGPTWTPGRIGPNALSFNGVNQYVENAGVTWPASQPVSVVLWVNTAGGTNNGTFGLAGVTGGANVGAHIPFSDNRLYWDYPGFGTGRISTDFTPYLNQWTHVALVSNGVDFRAIYLNGALITSTTTAGTAPTPTSGLEVGKYVINSGANTYYHTGAIDDFRLYTYVLSASEIAALYTQPSTRLRRLSAH
jgi:hypothetical protein